MMVVLLFLSTVGIVLLVVAALAIRRQLRQARDTMVPFDRIVLPKPGRDSVISPIISAPTVAGGTVTIGGIGRDSHLMLLLFIEAGAPLCEAVAGDAVELCSAMRVRLVLVGKGRPADYAGLLGDCGLSGDDLVLNPHMDDEFKVGPLPFGALIDAEGRILARGMVQRRAQLQTVLVDATATRK